MPKTARQTSTAVARTRKEAAIHLVRVEFDMNRLEMGIDQAQERVTRYAEELRQRQRERDTLLNILKS
ncbi:hypothetical protein RGUI_4059 [Rhodovulum sp. P5]|nr:hypothetical protein RGUI_4059 [Rhodovulum sp. P5]